MGKMVKSFIYGAGSLLDFTGTYGNNELKKRHQKVRSGLGKHMIQVKKHCDVAYSKIIK